MPEAPRISGQLSVLRTVALVSTLVVALGTLAAAQAPARNAGAGVFPLTPVWMVALDTSPALAPVYDDSRAFIVLAADADRGYSTPRLAAISLSDGSTRWSRDVGEVTALAIGDDQVFACDGRVLQAFATADGEPHWQLPLAAPPSAPLHSESGWLIVVTQDSEALAIRARDGARLWQVHLPSPATGEPAVAGDALYVPLTDNRVLRLKLETGAVVWDRKILSQPTTILALDDRVFVGTAQYWFYALQPEDGRVRWRKRVGSAVVGWPAADRSAVYFLALDNLLRALDRVGGSLKWRQILIRRERFGPLRVENLLFVSGPAPTIQAYDSASGTSAGSFDAPHDLAAPVHLVPGLLANDFLLVALTGEGELMALRPQSLQPEAFAVSPRVYLLTGFPVWRW